MMISRMIRYSVLLLILTLVGNDAAWAAAKTLDAAAVKAKVQARGVGKGVRVREADHTEVKGAIASIGEQKFQIRVQGAPLPVDLPYTQVVGIHNDGLSTGAKVGIVVGVVVVVVVIVAVALDHAFKSSFPKTIPI